MKSEKQARSMSERLDYIRYVGVGKEKYPEVLRRVMKKNISTAKFISMFYGLTMLAIHLAAWAPSASQFLVRNRPYYLLNAAVMLLCYGLCRLAKIKNMKILIPLVYLMLTAVYAGSITLAFHDQADQVLLVVLLVLPMAISDNPLRMNLMTVIAFIGGAIWFNYYLDPDVSFLSIAGAGVAAVLSIELSTIQNYSNFRKYAYEMDVEYLMYRDHLTGMYNQGAYFSDFDKLAVPGAAPEKMKIVAMDINELKSTNDTLGHEAGDELIAGAAECIRKAFEQYGKCYRNGGDEFSVIITGDSPSKEELYRLLRETAEAWHGDLVKSLTISCGIADSAAYENCTPALLRQEADRFLYLDKAAYYARTGKDRRTGN